jgi:hypothetical protein
VADIGDLAQDLILFAKKYSLGSIRGRFSSNKSRVKGDSRLCYNCNEAGHLARLCPYEKREDRLKPLNMRRDKCLLRHGVDVNHRPVGNPKRKV